MEQKTIKTKNNGCGTAPGCPDSSMTSVPAPTQHDPTRPGPDLTKLTYGILVFLNCCKLQQVILCLIF